MFWKRHFYTTVDCHRPVIVLKYISPKWSSLWYLHCFGTPSFGWCRKHLVITSIMTWLKLKSWFFGKKTLFSFVKSKKTRSFCYSSFFSNNRLIFWYKGNCLTTIHYSRKKTNSHMVGRFASLEKSAGRIISKNQLFCVFWCFCTKYFSQMVL